MKLKSFSMRVSVAAAGLASSLAQAGPSHVFTEQSAQPGMANVVSVGAVGSISESQMTIPQVLGVAAPGAKSVFVEQGKVPGQANLIVVDAQGRLVSERQMDAAQAKALAAASKGHGSLMVEQGKKPGTASLIAMDQAGRVVSESSMPSALALSLAKEFGSKDAGSSAVLSTVTEQGAKHGMVNVVAFDASGQIVSDRAISTEQAKKLGGSLSSKLRDRRADLAQDAPSKPRPDAGI